MAPESSPKVHAQKGTCEAAFDFQVRFERQARKSKASSPKDAAESNGKSGAT